mmetsp:Transcript_168104/g.534862  ORF Transcript_168104/g.534862 Transcript_168104/m.534862 type:complete len:210 (-) Transcript_168104:4-633(-)
MRTSQVRATQHPGHLLLFLLVCIPAATAAAAAAGLRASGVCLLVQGGGPRCLRVQGGGMRCLHVQGAGTRYLPFEGGMWMCDGHAARGLLEVRQCHRVLEAGVSKDVRPQVRLRGRHVLVVRRLRGRQVFVDDKLCGVSWTACRKMRQLRPNRCKKSRLQLAELGPDRLAHGRLQALDFLGNATVLIYHHHPRRKIAQRPRARRGKTKG